jgi:Arc/MetJ-type ribon-helix-helix transcriptional regulator
MKRTTVRLPEDLLDRARRRAGAEGRTLASLIEDGLRLILAENGKAAKGKRALPRASTATGGPMPGIDLADGSALQEMDDLEYVERMKQFK